MARQRNPAARSEPAAGGRVTRVPFLLVTSLWASTAPQERRERRSRPQRGGGQDARSQEQWLARHGWREKKHRDVSRLSRQRPKVKARSWIPAFAGMTKRGLSPEWRS